MVWSLHDDETVAFIGLGSNLDNPSQQIQQALDTLGEKETIRLLATSSLYRSPPMGPANQPDYVNAVAAVASSLPPLSLLRDLQAIELAQGRVRLEHWGARTLDLDILLYGNQTINLSELIVPHQGLAERHFVLYPLHEIAPDLIIPDHGPLTQLLANCPMADLQRID